MVCQYYRRRKVLVYEGSALAQRRAALEKMDVHAGDQAGHETLRLWQDSVFQYLGPNHMMRDHMSSGLMKMQVVVPKSARQHEVLCVYACACACCRQWSSRRTAPSHSEVDDHDQQARV